MNINNQTKINHAIDDLKKAKDLGYFKGNTMSTPDNLENLDYLKSELGFLMNIVEEYTEQVKTQAELNGEYVE